MAHMDPQMLARILSETTDTNTEETNTAYYTDTTEESVEEREDSSSEEEEEEEEEEQEDETTTEHVAHDAYDDDGYYNEEPDTESEEETAETESETEVVAGGESHDVDSTPTWDQEDSSSEEEEASGDTTDDEDRQNNNAHYDEDYANPVDNYLPPDADLSDPELPSDTDDESGIATTLDGGVYKARSPYIGAPPSADTDRFLSSVTPHLNHQLELVQSGYAVSATELSELLFREARYYDVVTGKWLVFASPDVAASLWSDVRYACQTGALLANCELRARPGASSDWLIAAHVHDWRDASACHSVREALQAVCERHGARVAAFKPELLTIAGVYSEGGTYPAHSLGLSTLPSPLHAPRTHLARRRRRRGGGGGSNSHYHGSYSNPSLPNGAWDSQETAQGWVYHHGRPAYVQGRGGTRHESTLIATLRARLDEYQARIYSGESPSSRERRAFMASLWELGDSHDAVVGKWKLFAPARVADGCWRALCDANDEGRLGGCMKLSPYNSRSGAFLICVYCNDFRDISDCSRVLTEAARCVAPYGARFVANFKPDFMSSVGVYRSSVRGYRAQYALAELGLLGEWMDEQLRAVLARHRRETRGW